MACSYLPLQNADEVTAGPTIDVGICDLGTSAADCFLKADVNVKDNPDDVGNDPDDVSNDPDDVCNDPDEVCNDPDDVELARGNSPKNIKIKLCHSIDFQILNG